MATPQHLERAHDLQHVDIGQDETSDRERPVGDRRGGEPERHDRRQREDRDLRHADVRTQTVQVRPTTLEFLRVLRKTLMCHRLGTEALERLAIQPDQT